MPAQLQVVGVISSLGLPGEVYLSETSDEKPYSFSIAGPECRELLFIFPCIQDVITAYKLAARQLWPADWNEQVRDLKTWSSANELKRLLAKLEHSDIFNSGCRTATSICWEAPKSGKKSHTFCASGSNLCYFLYSSPPLLKFFGTPQHASLFNDAYSRLRNVQDDADTSKVGLNQLSDTVARLQGKIQLSMSGNGESRTVTFSCTSLAWQMVQGTVRVRANAVTSGDRLLAAVAVPGEKGYGGSDAHQAVNVVTLEVVWKTCAFCSLCTVVVTLVIQNLIFWQKVSTVYTHMIRD